MPNWKNFQEQAYDLTEQEIIELSKEVVEQYNIILEDILKQLEKAYAKVLANVDTDDYYNAMLQYNRLDNMFTQITQEYNQKYASIRSLTVNAQSLGFSNTYYRKLYASQWITPLFDFTVVPQSMIELSIFGTADAFKKLSEQIGVNIAKGLVPERGTLSALMAEQRTAGIKAIQDAITQGLLNGESYNTMAKRITSVIGEGNEIKASGLKARALRILRTEANRTMNDGAYANQLAALEQGINIQKMWSAVLDSRTRPVHGKLDGQVRPIDKPFSSSAGPVMRPGQFSSIGQNINCRCSTIDIIDNEKPTLRRGRNPVTGKNEVFDYKNYDQWAKENSLVKNKYGEYVFKKA